MTKSAGPFVPTMSASTRYSMAGDDCSLHFDLSTLTPKQAADHASNQVLTAMLQVALLYIAKPTDEVCLYDTFQQPRWREALAAYRQRFVTMGLTPAALSQVQYHPMHDFYASVSRCPSDSATETLYMTSGSNLPLHNDAASLATSANLNSKVHFAAHAPAFGLTVPDTLHCSKAELDGPVVQDFFNKHPTPIMLKTLGLAGARNVTQVMTPSAASDYVHEYAPTMDIILQQRLDTQHYTEMTVDLDVSERSIAVTNVRRILFADGLWVGNLMGGAVELPRHHEQALLQVGEYARSHGFQHPLGLNLGIDYFIRNPDAPESLPELVVTEINARWTGGLFPAELVRRLGVEDQPVVASIDTCPPAAFERLQGFIDDHLYTPGHSAAFRIAPMGFAPFPVELDGQQQLFVWQLVIGDFEAFKAVRQASLDATILPTVPIISTGL